MNITRKVVWKIIEQSKKDTNFNSEKQALNFQEILRNYSREDLKKIREMWYDIQREYTNRKDFDDLHLNYGGFVEGGDDKFYGDFGNWIVAQGKQLYFNIHKLGIKPALKNYIHT